MCYVFSQFVWSGHPRLVFFLICTPENTHVSYTFKLSIACLSSCFFLFLFRLIIECLVDTLLQSFRHSRIVPLSLLLWTSLKSSEFTKFSAINYHPVCTQIFALSQTGQDACTLNVYLPRHDQTILKTMDKRCFSVSTKFVPASKFRGVDPRAFQVFPLRRYIYIYIFFCFIFLSDTARNIHNIISTHVSVVHYSCV